MLVTEYDGKRRNPGLRRNLKSPRMTSNTLGTVLTVTPPQLESYNFTRIILDPD